MYIYHNRVYSFIYNIYIYTIITNIIIFVEIIDNYIIALFTRKTLIYPQRTGKNIVNNSANNNNSSNNNSSNNNPSKKSILKVNTIKGIFYFNITIILEYLLYIYLIYYIYYFLDDKKNVKFQVV